MYVGGAYTEETEKAGVYGMRLGGDKYTYYQNPIPVNQVNNRNRVIDQETDPITLAQS